MKFFCKLRDVFLRFFSKIKCNSSCFNDNHISNHNEKIIYYNKKDN